MNRSANPSAIPPEAQARRARLAGVLAAMMEAAPSREHRLLQELQDALAGRPLRDRDAWVKAIADADLAEEAEDMVRAFRRDAADQASIQWMQDRLSPLALKARHRRTALWQMDTRRVLVRFHYAKENGAIGFDDGDLRAVFLQAFRLEGLALALDLGKRPRPLLNPGLPLAAEAGGWTESMDAVLKSEPAEDAGSLVARLNQRLPEGLKIHRWQILPSCASPVGDLAWRAHWRWMVPDELRALAAERFAAFMAAEAWPWDRGGSKQEGPLDLRAVVEEMVWEEDALRITTRMGPFQALNPMKAVGAILGMEPSRIQGFARTGVDLKADPRLSQAGRFEPKLKNMYEDAVLLGGGSNITLVDEDDDEPIQLGAATKQPHHGDTECTEEFTERNTE